MRKRKHDRKPRICFVSSSGGHWEQLQKLKPLAKYFMIPSSHKDKSMPFVMAVNCIHAAWIWIKERPDFVITTGTITAYPFYLLAIVFRKKFVYIETFGRADMPTVAGKKMEKHSDLFIVQWESQKKYYKKAIYGGCLY